MLRQLIEELAFPINECIPTHCENKVATHKASNTVLHETRKHIEVDCHIIGEKPKELFVHCS